MLCRFVFGFWWSIFCMVHFGTMSNHVSYIIWSVDKHTTNIVSSLYNHLLPLPSKIHQSYAQSMNDQVNLRIVRTTPQEMGIVTIKQANMNVYETDYRDNEMEKYHIQIPTTAVDNMQLNLLQNDSHYSPFRSWR